MPVIALFGMVRSARRRCGVIASSRSARQLASVRLGSETGNQAKRAPSCLKDNFARARPRAERSADAPSTSKNSAENRSISPRRAFRPERRQEHVRELRLPTQLLPWGSAQVSALPKQTLAAESAYSPKRGIRVKPQ